MNLLLDTHGLIWWLANERRLGEHARMALSDPRNAVYVSVATAWEMAIKVGLGRLDVPNDVGTWLPGQLAANRFRLLPIELKHVLAVEHLPHHHRDPFDRLLVAQAQAERLTLLTSDPQILRYGIRLLDASR